MSDWRRFEWEVPRTIPIHGYWSCLYGNLATVQIALSGGNRYSVTATTKIRLAGSNHWLPSGTLLGRFWRTSNHDCTGEHSMYSVESGQFARWIEFPRSYVSG